MTEVDQTIDGCRGCCRGDSETASEPGGGCRARGEQVLHRCEIGGIHREVVLKRLAKEIGGINEIAKQLGCSMDRRARVSRPRGQVLARHHRLVCIHALIVRAFTVSSRVTSFSSNRADTAVNRISGIGQGE